MQALTKNYIFEKTVNLKVAKLTVDFIVRAFR